MICTNHAIGNTAVEIMQSGNGNSDSNKAKTTNISHLNEDRRTDAKLYRNDSLCAKMTMALHVCQPMTAGTRQISGTPWVSLHVIIRKWNSKIRMPRTCSRNDECQSRGTCTKFGKCRRSKEGMKDAMRQKYVSPKIARHVACCPTYRVRFRNY